MSTSTLTVQEGIAYVDAPNGRLVNTYVEIDGKRYYVDLAVGETTTKSKVNEMFAGTGDAPEDQQKDGVQLGEDDPKAEETDKKA